MVTRNASRTRFYPTQADWDWARMQYGRLRTEADIAADLGVKPQTVHRRAIAGGWTRNPTLLSRLSELIETELHRTRALPEEGANGAERRGRAVLALTRAAILIAELEEHDKDPAAPKSATEDQAGNLATARDAVDRDIDRILARLRASQPDGSDDGDGA